MSTFLAGLSPQVQIVVVLCLCVCIMALIGGVMTLLLLVAKSRRAANNLATLVSGFVTLSTTRNARQLYRRPMSKPKLSRRTKK